MKRSLSPSAPTLLLIGLAALLPGCSTCTADVAPASVADTGADTDGQDTGGETPDARDDADPGDADPDIPAEVGPDAEATAVPSGQGVLAGGGVRRSGRFQVKMSVGGPVAGQPDTTDEHRVRTGTGAPQAAEVPPESP